MANYKIIKPKTEYCLPNNAYFLLLIGGFKGIDKRKATKTIGSL